MEKVNLEKIVKARTKLGYTQEQVAKAIGVTRYNWCKKEKGACSITLIEALTVAKMFNMTVEELFAYDN